MNDKEIQGAMLTITFKAVHELADGYTLRQWPASGAWALHKPDGMPDYFLSPREELLANLILSANKPADAPLFPSQELLKEKAKGCNACFGSGGKKSHPCPVCNGSGKVIRP